MKEKLSNKKGAALLIVSVIMTVILGVTALVVDVGLVFLEKNELKNTADSAALAGALELPNYPSKAVDIALDYVEKNGFPRELAQVIILDNNYTVQVSMNSDVQYKFARILGFSDAELDVTSKVIVGSASAVYGGTRPFVVEQRQFTYGQQVILKENAGDDYHGNYGATALGGTGADIFENNIKFGYEGKLEVGDMLSTEPGNMAGSTLDGVDYIINGIEDIVYGDYCTFDNYTPDSRRLWTIPIVDSLSVDGRDYVQIVGFALFFLEGAEKKSGQAEISGRFIEFVTNADITSGQASYGLYGIKLVE